MKIAMIGQKGIPAIHGGIERHAQELSIELTKNGHEVLVYARKWYAKNTLLIPGIKTIFTPTIHTKHLDAIVHTFFSTLHALWQKPDVIHYHGVGPSLLSWIPRVFAPRVKVISTFHCIDRYHQKWGFLARWFLKLGEKASCSFPHVTIAVSKTIQAYCLNEYHKNTVYIPNGVNIPEAVDNKPLDTWQLRPNKYVVMISRLIRHKGAHYLIAAWKNAKTQRPELFKDLKLAIVGGSSYTDDYVKELHAMARDDKDIVFTDWQSDVALEALYANAKLMAHPSENEGLPITILHAMACSKPVLVSGIPEHQEVIFDSRFWFSNANIDSLAEKMIQLLSDDELLAGAGKANRETVIKYFNWTDITRHTLTQYKLTGAPSMAAAVELKKIPL